MSPARWPAWKAWQRPAARRTTWRTRAEAIAAGWWWDAYGDLTPERLVLLVQELQRWCAVAAGRHALRWDHLNRAGRPRDAEDGRPFGQALDWEQQASCAYA